MLDGGGQRRRERQRIKGEIPSHFWLLKSRLSKVDACVKSSRLLHCPGEKERFQHPAAKATLQKPVCQKLALPVAQTAANQYFIHQSIDFVSAQLTACRFHWQ